jgi:hypothetical protein
MDRAQWDVLLYEIGSIPQFQINDRLAFIHSNYEKLATNSVRCDHLANFGKVHYVRHFTGYRNEQYTLTLAIVGE